MQIIPRLALLLGATLPLAQGLPQLVADEEFVSHGVFEHDGVTFELQSRNASASPAEAYKAYLESVQTVDKRSMDPKITPAYSWSNCTAEGTFVGGCSLHNYTAPKGFYAEEGRWNTKHLLEEMLIEAFKGNRTELKGKDKPQSICRTSHHGHTLCVAWEDKFKSAPLRKDVRKAVVNFAVDRCEGPNGLLSSMFRLGFDADPKKLPEPEFRIVCLSNRAKGCTWSTHFCEDLWSKDPDKARTKMKDHSNQWNDGGFHLDWNRHGACKHNCDII